VKKIMLSRTHNSCTIRVKYLVVVEDSGILLEIVRNSYAKLKDITISILTAGWFSLVYLPLLDFI
jgi:hypothetical protein